MASLKMSVSHKLSQQEALSRIKGMIGKLKEEQKDKISNVKEEWNGDSGSFQFTVQGFDLSGTIHVRPKVIDIDARLPFAVSLFKGTIKEIIDKKAKELLS